MRQMAAMGEIHRQDGVAMIEGGEIDGHVRLGPGMGLDVGALGAEQLQQPFDGEPLGDIDELAAAVIALARIALGVLVGQHGALGRQDGGAGVVLRSDHLQAVLLPLRFVRDGGGDFRIGGFQGVHANAPRRGAAMERL